MDTNKCTDCEFEYGSFDCSRDLVTNEFTGQDSNTKDRDLNKDGKCPRFFQKCENFKSTLPYSAEAIDNHHRFDDEKEPDSGLE